VALSLDLSSRLGSLSARDRRTLLVGGIVAAVLFVLAVILPLDHSVSRLHEQVAKKESDLMWMRSAAPEIAAAGPVQSNASGESLIVIVDQSARESGLGGSLAGSQPSGRGSLSVQLEKAPFDALVGWLARLSQQNGVQIESATIDSAGQPGTVNASLVLKSP
jgi:general secretion pathway protein M